MKYFIQRKRSHIVSRLTGLNMVFCKYHNKYFTSLKLSAFFNGLLAYIDRKENFISQLVPHNMAQWTSNQQLDSI